MRRSVAILADISAGATKEAPKFMRCARKFYYKCHAGEPLFKYTLFIDWKEIFKKIEKIIAIGHIYCYNISVKV